MKKKILQLTLKKKKLKTTLVGGWPVCYLKDVEELNS